LCSACIEPSITHYGGKIFRKLGDGILVTFPDAHDAVTCVIDIQRFFADQSHEGPTFKLRAAVHAGEVALWDGDLQGNAVNITSRLQEFAAPGGIVISAAVEELVRGRIAEPMENVGDIALKGIERRVRAYSLLELPAWLRESRGPSIAILPFSESDARDGDYFGDGMVEDIVNALAATPGLFVVSRASTLAFLSGTSSLKQVQQALGVRYVLSGSVRRTSQRIRITAELSECESMSVLWSDKIDGEFDDIFSFQDRVAQHIVATIAPQLQKAEISRIAQKRPENFSAYDCFLRGLELVYQLDRKRFDSAKDMFARAIQLDPGYASPYAYSALWHAVRIGQGWSTWPDWFFVPGSVTHFTA
jgi:adenylate cyclase